VAPPVGTDYQVLEASTRCSRRLLAIFGQAGGKCQNKCQNLSPANKHFPRDGGAENARRKPATCRDFHHISTMRALYLREARLGVEIGPYLLGFSHWAGDWQSHRYASDVSVRHVKKAPFAGIYGAYRDRTGDLLLAKQALSQLS
jgi:hypothetical protein